MTANEKLNKLMELKQEILKSNIIFNTSGYTYYSLKDRDTILSWSPDKAENIWISILKRIEYEPDYLPKNKIFTDETCPFCNYYRHCKDCNYSGKDTICDKADLVLYPMEDLSLIRDLVNYIENEKE